MIWASNFFPDLDLMAYLNLAKASQLLEGKNYKVRILHSNNHYR